MEELTVDACIELKGKLERRTKEEDLGGLRDILQQLKSTDARGKLQALSSTGLSKVVQRLSKHTDSQIATESNAIVQKWRALCAPKAKSLATPAAPPAPTAPAAAKVEPKVESSSSVASASSSSVLVLTGDQVRDSVRQKLYETFEKGIADNENMLRELATDAAQMAQDAEMAMFERFGDPNKDYKQRFRSLAFNLRDPKNPGFILSVVSGARHVNDLATMDIKEMASDEVKKQREKWVEQSKMALMDEKSYNNYSGKKVEDGILKCPKCKSMKTEYVEVQTRSADEPTTKKCFCNGCNYRWKFC